MDPHLCPNCGEPVGPRRTEPAPAPTTPRERAAARRRAAYDRLAAAHRELADAIAEVQAAEHGDDRRAAS
jgi:hypothetical protein